MFHLSGMRMMPQMTFHQKVLSPGMRASRESAKSTTRATHAPRSSREKSRDVSSRALGPNETKARSANVMSDESTSKHLARILAVYDVTTAAQVKAATEPRQKRVNFSDDFGLPACDRLKSD